MFRMFKEKLLEVSELASAVTLTLGYLGQLTLAEALSPSDWPLALFVRHYLNQ